MVGLDRDSGPPGHDELADHGLYSCPRWLRMLERGGRVPAAYLTGEPGRDAIGVLPYHRTPPTSNRRYSTAHLMTGLPPELARKRWSYAGPMSAYQCDVPVVAGADPAILIRLARTRAEQDGQPLVVPYLTARTADLLPDDLRSHLVLADFESWFTADAGDLAAYIRSLGHKRRENLTRDLRLFRAAGLVDAVEPLADRMGEFAGLVGASSRKYGLAQDDSGLVDHLRTIDAEFGPEAVIFTARTGSGRLVGGVLGIFHGDALYQRMAGFDYAATERASAYFQLAYYTPLDHRGQRPHVRVHHGTELLAMKLRHGARPVPLWTLLWESGAPPAGYDRVSWDRFAALTGDLPAGVVAQLRDEVAGVTGSPGELVDISTNRSRGEPHED